MPGVPDAVAWGIIGPHEEQAMKNHGQTLIRLAERGGLGPLEFRCVYEDRGWPKVSQQEIYALDLEAAAWIIRNFTER